MRLRTSAGVLALALLLGACTGTDLGTSAPTGETTTAQRVPPSPEVVSPAEEGPGSSAAATQRLCEVSQPNPGGGSDVPAEGPTPPVIAEVMDEVEQLRGFGYSHPVVAEPVTQAEIARDIVKYADIAYPRGQFARRSVAWDTIGVIPNGTSLRHAYETFGSTQVIGYYDTVTGELKFIGTDDPTPLERFTLSHELTHAIDDQRFGLERLDALGAACRDEESAAAIALVEGNATFFMLRWARTFLSANEQVQLAVEAGQQDASTEGIPPFVLQLQAFPYDDGLRFVGTLNSLDGLHAVDEAFRNLPVSTEQILHPERYPNDVPTPVDVPDLSADLGSGWKDLDVMGVGEAWLKIALGLRLDGATAAAAAAGWDGGTYRAWSNGDRTAVVLSTVWDKAGDAQEFDAAMAAWIDDGGEPGIVLEPKGKSATVLFATDAATLKLLEAAEA